MKSFSSKHEEKHYFETQASETAYLDWYKQQTLPKYDMPSVTIDNVLMCYNKTSDQLKLLLVQRNTHPYQYSWALPGGFVKRTEATEETCMRETFEETGVSIDIHNLAQLHTFSDPYRDPRGWVITVSYLAFIGEEPLTAGDDTREAKWFTLERKDHHIHLTNEDTKAHIILDLDTGDTLGPDTLAFDHAKIILTAFNHITEKMHHEPNVLQVLGEDFSITEARKVFAKFLGISYKDIDHSNFKKAMLEYLVEVGERPTGIGRPSKIYRLKDI